MFAAEYALSPREKMFFAKQALIEAEKKDVAEQKARRKSRHRLASLAPSLDSERSDSLTPKAGPSVQPHSAQVGSSSSRSILRRTPMSTCYPPVSPHSSMSIPLTHSSSSQSLSPASARGLTPSKSPSHTDFALAMDRSQSITLGSLERRTSRVRFSVQDPGQPQGSSFPHAVPMGRSQSASSKQEPKQEHPQLRRESSMNSLRQDIMTGRGSLNKRPSYASSIASDPFGWASRGSIESRLSQGGPSSDLDAEGSEFRPQSLRYPKLGPAFARLSIDTTVSDTSVDSSGSSVASPSLRQTLDRTSLDSANDFVKTKPSLDARLASMSSVSSYAPSYAPHRSAGSSIAGTDFGSSRSSLSSIPPPRDSVNAAAYISLLPSRTSSSNHPMPSINRGDWVDADLGLSPRSGPTIFHTRSRESLCGSSGVASTRRSSVFSTNALSPKSPSIELEAEHPPVSPQLSDRTDDEDTPMRSDSIDFMAAAVAKVPASHKRTESTLSAIMSFPIPPDREVTLEPEAKLFTQRSTIEKLLATDTGSLGVETALTVEIVHEVQTPLFTQVSPTPCKVESKFAQNRGANLAAESAAVWLNSPDPDIDQSAKLKPADHMLKDDAMPDLIGVVFPPTDDVQPAPIVEETQQVKSTEEEEVPRPKSPELSEMLRRIPRARRARRMSTGTDGETEESDLDVNTPLVNVALRSNILTPSSRLLSTSPLAESSVPRRPSTTRTTSSNSVSSLSLRSGVSLTSGMGWSGSESEEEGWIETVRTVSIRRKTPPIRLNLSTSTSSTRTSTPTSTVQRSIKPMIGSVAMSSEPDRLSQLSSTSMSTIQTTLESAPLTPYALDMDSLSPGLMLISRTSSRSDISGASSSGNISPGSAPGDFPWGQSSPPTSPVRARIRSKSGRGRSIKSAPISSGSYDSSRKDSSASNSTSGSASSEPVRPKLKRAKSILPPPMRSIEGWGAPEVLMDDRDWESSMLVSASSTSSDLPSVSSLGTGFSTPSQFDLGLESDDDDDDADAEVAEREDEAGEGEGEREGAELIQASEEVWSSRRLSGAGTFGEPTPQLSCSAAFHDQEIHETTPKARHVARAPSPDIWSSLLGPACAQHDDDDDNVLLEQQKGEGQWGKSLMDEEMPEDLDLSASSSEIMLVREHGAPPLRPKKSLLRKPSSRKFPKI